MGKFFMFSAVLLAGVLLFQLNNERVNYNDAFQVVAGEKNVVEILKEKPVAEPEASSGDDTLSILAFGDMMMGRFVRVLMDKHGMHYVFDNLKSEEESFFEGMGLEETDVVFANLEGPIKGEGRKGGTSMVFAFKDDIGNFLADNGFDLVSISNNHAVDAGWDGRASTIKNLSDSGVGFCGHPSEVDADSVYYGKAGDKFYAFVCFHDVTFHLDDDSAVKLISTVSQNVDYVIVSPHWGIEYKHQADQKLQVEPARAWIDAGADLVLGHHPHVVQNFEVYKDRFIFYSLGNFVFDQYWSKPTQEELALRIELEENDGGWFGEDTFATRIKLIPMKSEKSQSRLMNDEERAEWTLRFIGYGKYDEAMKQMVREGEIVVVK